MSENKSENRRFRGWLDISDKVGINLNEVIMITFSDENAKPIVLYLKSGEQVNIENVTPDMSDKELFESLSRYLKSKTERDDRIRVNSFELLKSILSELKIISEKL